MIYLDNASTTRIDDRVLKEMMPYLQDDYGNAGTIYSFGRESAEAIARARGEVADFIGAERHDQIIFTSGGSEANNMVLFGLEDYLKNIGKTRILLSEIEHDSLINAANSLIKRGFDVTYIHPNNAGVITAESVKSLLDEYCDVGLVSVMAVNNETGIENEVYGIGGVCDTYNVLFHTDCVQAAGCFEIDVDEIKCDFLSISSHKIHGPKGVGALYAKDKSILKPMIYGGTSQEFGFRAGTENTPGIVGFGAACDVLNDELYKDMGYMEDLLIKLYSELNDNLKNNGVGNILSVNGRGHRVKTVNLRFADIDAETLLLILDASGVCVSAGSACRSHESEPSRVLKAIGLSDEEARNSIRISVSKYTTLDEIKEAAEIISVCVALLSNGA